MIYTSVVHVNAFENMQEGSRGCPREFPVYKAAPTLTLPCPPPSSAVCGAEAQGPRPPSAALVHPRRGPMAA